MKYNTIAKTIISLKDADLQLRDKLAKSGKLFNGYNPEMEALHNHNAMVLDSIIDEIGYPSINKVGEEANEAAWLVIQHAVSQPRFMIKCEKLLEKAVENKEANPVNLAYLSDRIAAFKGRPQRYGTQFDWDRTGQLSPKPYDDLVKVNERRGSLGLNTLEEQTALMRQRANAENEVAPTDLAKRNQDAEEWKRRVGWIK